MEAAIIGALLKITLPKLWSVILEKGKLLTGGLVDSVQSIQSELKFIHAAIQDCYRSSSRDLSHVRRVWIQELRPLAYDIEDCIERFLRRIMSHGAMEMMFHGGQFAGEIRRLRERSQHIRTLLETYNINEPIGCAVGASGSSTSSATAPPPGPPGHLVMGITALLDDLRELLLLRGTTGAPSRKLKVISVVGFGGLGKTFLAHQAYHDEDVREQFPLRAWVCAAAGKGALELLHEILQQLQQSGTQIQLGAASASDAHTLTGLLNAGRYLIVVDDVRTTRQWDMIMSAFPSKKDGVDISIIVTTTIQSVAKHCSYGNGHVYKMPRLCDEDSKELFLRLCHHGPWNGSTPAMELDSSAHLKKCDGLPLALVSTSQFVKNNGGLSKMRCEEACRRLCTPERCDGDVLERMQQVLAGNYDSLSVPQLQLCLLYFCMFPHDHHVRKKSLIRRWLAEELVQDPLDAVRNLEALIDRSIIQSMEAENNGNVKRCKPPGMMLDYISRKSLSENFVTTLFTCQESDLGSQQPNAHVRRLSLHHVPQGAANSPKDLSSLRTLAIFNNSSKEEEEATAMNYEANYIKLASCDLLRVLDLEEYDCLNNSHLKEICKQLLLLKYLSLGGNSITEVPKEIENLEFLETLDLRRSKVQSVPMQVIKLPQLKHLLGKFRLISRGSDSMFRKKKLHRFLSEDSKLETLSGFVTGDSISGFPQLMLHMKRLKKVKIWCCDSATGREDLQAHLSQAIMGFMRDGNNRPDDDRALSIDFQHHSQPQGFLDSLRAPGRVTSLKLSGKLAQFPPFATELSGIEELCLSRTGLTGDLLLRALNKLRILKYLKLVEDELGPLEIGPEHLPSLQRICLVGVRSLQQGSITILPGALPYLVSLHVICQGLDGLCGINIRQLGGLEQVALDSLVAPETKIKWQAAAKGHPNRPEVLFVDQRHY